MEVIPEWNRLIDIVERKNIAQDRIMQKQGRDIETREDKIEGRRKFEAHKRRLSVVEAIWGGQR